jgi:hypothetical protein
MKHAILAAGALLLSAPALADPITIPTEICRGYFFIPVTLPARDDRPEDRTLWFLYDTGASSSFVDPDSIERISGMRVETGNRARIRDASMGTLTVGMRPRVTELDHLSIALGREIDGILAFDAFDNYLLTIDYGAMEMRLDTGELPRPDNNSVFSARGPDDRPWLRVMVGDRARRILIDSGAAGTAFAVRDLHRYDLENPARPIGASVRFSRIEYRDGGRLADPVTFGPYRIENPLISEVPETELFGGEAMSHFVWTFDQQNERVRIVPVTPGATMEIPSERHHGMALRPVRDGLHVESILPDSGAENADIQAGDVITHIMGAPVRGRGCGMEGLENWTVTRVRDGEAADIDIPLVTLVE